jgi:hypothetical protein
MAIDTVLSDELDYSVNGVDDLIFQVASCEQLTQSVLSLQISTLSSTLRTGKLTVVSNRSPGLISLWLPANSPAAAGLVDNVSTITKLEMVGKPPSTKDYFMLPQHWE